VPPSSPLALGHRPVPDLSEQLVRHHLPAEASGQPIKNSTFPHKKRADIWRRYLNGCFESLDLIKMSAMNINKNNIIYLDARRLIQAIGFHIHDLACLSIDSPGVFAVRVFGLTNSALNRKAKKKVNNALSAPLVPE
jgi:hypothetical protein